MTKFKKGGGIFNILKLSTLEISMKTKDLMEKSYHKLKEYWQIDDPYISLGTDSMVCPNNF